MLLFVAPPPLALVVPLDADKRLSFKLAADEEFGDVDFERESYESLGDVGKPPLERA